MHLYRIMKSPVFSISLLGLILISNISFSQSKKNIVIAHRGAWKANHLPTNSIASLLHAAELKGYGSEFDVHLTKDDVLVVCHDHDFYGIDIEKATYQELLQKKHPNGESIPTAKEYILAGKKHKRTKLIYELKASEISKERTLEAAVAAVKLVKELGAEKQVEYISFDYDALKKILEVNPKAKVSYLNGDIAPADAKKDGMYGLDYNIGVYKKHPSWIKEAQDLGLKINVWTVNKKDDMLQMLDQQVDYITTDEPELLFEVIKERKN